MSAHTTYRPAIPMLLAAIAASLACGLAGAPPAFAAAGEGCPNEQVRAESNFNPATGQPFSQGLPECRAYEMVSPLEKQAHDASFTGASGGPIVSPNGDAIGYESEGAFANAENSALEQAPELSYVGKRTATGWTTESALAPASVISKPTEIGFVGDASLDLSTLTTCGSAGDFVSASGAGPSFACARRTPDGIWAKTPDYPDLTGTTGGTPVVWGSSSDLSDVVWQPGEDVGLLPGDEVRGGGTGAIYETTGVGTSTPKLRMVSVNNENTALTNEDGGAGPCLGATRRSPDINGSVYHAISSDGQTIYFVAGASSAGSCQGTLYARTGDFAGGTPASPTTVEIAGNATYQGACADGSKVFFTTTQKLADTDTDNTPDLYEYNFDSPAGHHYTQVSAGGLGDPSPGTGAEVASVTAISSDGSHVYFASSSVLTTLPNGNGEHASQGSSNLYGYDTETDQTQFVGNQRSDDPSTAQTTPDGRYLIFTTTAHLSPEDTNDGTAIYRYDFQTGDLAWVSHAGPGFAVRNEDDGAVLPSREANNGAMAYFEDAQRAISEDGEYIVFSTSEKLQADDVGGGPQVYLWHNGAVSLVSDGENAAGVSEPIGMSASGSDVVFATTTRLVGQDTDSLQDVYDARIAGGFPAPTPEPSCSGEACQGAPSGSPSFGDPSTSSFTGGGNVVPSAPIFVAPFEAKPKLLTRAQKLVDALKGCKKDKPKTRRATCEKQARKRYRAKKRPKNR